MIKNILGIMLIMLIAQVGNAQPEIMDPAFKAEVDQLITFSVPTVSCKDLKQLMKAGDVVLLDTREQVEYNISHIKGAKYLGYNRINMALLSKVDKKATIVVYCSIGFRSEKIGEKLVKMGYTNVYNLYGSIFEWVNQGNVVVDKSNKTTNKVHAYNKEWSAWLKKGEKVFD